MKNVLSEWNLLTKKCVPAKKDVLTNKMYYPGCTVEARVRVEFQYCWNTHCRGREVWDRGTEKETLSKHFYKN